MVDPNITTLCSIFSESDNGSSFSEAVDHALEICKNIAPSTRFRLIETPTKNFLMVTNVLPKNRKTVEKVSLNIKDAMDRLAQSFAKDTSIRSSQSYSANYMNATSVGSSNSVMVGSYITYTKKDLENALSLDKSAFVAELLKYVDVPGILCHDNVSDPECLLWLLFCGPYSFCSSDICLGYRKEDFRNAFPVLLPPCFYNIPSDYGTYISLAELYAYSWYRNFSFDDVEHLQPVARERIQKTLTELRSKFCNFDVNLNIYASTTCLFCALYNQNRLAIDYASTNLRTSPISPIIIKDCSFLQTNVFSGHMQLGKKSVAVFPIYDIARLFGSMTISGDKISFDF
ncbi:component of prereplication complexes [Suid betaherpesvirus 2]|uniref:Component of prereplication complexes n=1 Tax=Suid betaherpesvirus 2 TaxID=1608255 RepID=U3GS48_9BETA|nr:component of prereplication complexes [Suid betaherpesvirus 2]AGT99259.1 component of prereplication complexes [Suid betaherpesvirus 2]